MRGKYHIQWKIRDSDKWKTDLRMQGMGKDFAKGAFFALSGLAGGSLLDYRLVKCDVPPYWKTPEESIEVLDTHSRGTITLNAKDNS